MKAVADCTIKELEAAFAARPVSEEFPAACREDPREAAARLAPAGHDGGALIPQLCRVAGQIFVGIIARRNNHGSRHSASPPSGQNTIQRIK